MNKLRLIMMFAMTVTSSSVFAASSVQTQDFALTGEVIQKLSTANFCTVQTSTSRFTHYLGFGSDTHFEEASLDCGTFNIFLGGQVSSPPAPSSRSQEIMTEVMDQMAKIGFKAFGCEKEAGRTVQRCRATKS